MKNPTDVDAHSDLNNLDSDSDGSTSVDAACSQAEQPSDTPFQFTKQGQWVAVYYFEEFYIGQVFAMRNNSQEATVQYLEKTNGGKDCFRWLKREDVADTSAHYVFQWDFECLPVSIDHRIWQVTDVDEFADVYAQISKQ